MNVNFNITPPHASVSNPHSPVKSPPSLVKWKVRVKNGVIDPSPDSKAKRRLFDLGAEDSHIIYTFKKVTGRKSGRSYVGEVTKTETNNFSKRFSTYKTRINKSGKRTHIENALVQSPGNFRVAIKKIIPADTMSEREVLEVEEQFQNLLRTNDRKYGYNHSKPTQEPSRTGPRKPRDPTKIKTERMKKTTISPRDKTTPRVAALVAKESLKKTFETYGLE